MSRFTIEKAIERRHGHDPGISAGLRRVYAGIVDGRKGLKRATQFVKNAGLTNTDTGAVGGLRELHLVRDRLDEAEMWLAAAIHGIKSEPFPPADRTVSVGVEAAEGIVPPLVPPVTEEELRIVVMRSGRRLHVVVTHLISGVVGEAEGESELLVRRAALDDLLAKLEVVGA